ncbi:MAG: MBL fold metallo-hydrolase [Desulfomonilaceae bacterium]
MPPVEIMKDLFFIQRGYLNGNHFVYRSQDPVLIDTAYVSDFETTAALIQGLGVDLSHTRLIVSTHCHCDHIGGNKIIQERSSCDIAMHQIGKHFIDTRDDWSTWWKYYQQDADFFNCHRALVDGDKLFVGPHEFEVIYTPGHSSDGIVLYNSDEKILISSDTLWENDLAVMTIRVEGSRACFSMLESLEKLEKRDVKMVYPGHGRPFSNMPEAISRARQRLNGFIANPKLIGNDLIKKIMIYTLMMRKQVDEASFFENLMQTHWFKETVELYFDGAYRTKYDDIMKSFFQRGIVKSRDGKLYTTVKP